MVLLQKACRSSPLKSGISSFIFLYLLNMRNLYLFIYLFKILLNMR